METSILLLLGWFLILGDRSPVLADKLITMRKQTGSIGQILLIGAYSKIPLFEETLPGAIGKASCNKSEGTTYKRDYDTKIHLIVDDESQDEEEPLSEYFIQVYADVYDCKQEVDKENGDESKIVNFQLIYQKLVSIKDIQAVEFHPEIKVSVKKFDVDRVQVEERKCFLGDESPKQFECETQVSSINSFVGIEQPGNTPTYIPNIERMVFKYETVKKDGYEKYQPVADTKRTISDDGRIILIEKSPFTTGEPTKKYDCQYPTFLNTELFLPKYYQKVGNLSAVIPKGEFQELFMIVEREVRVCQCNDNDKDVIYRVKHTVIGRAEVSEIEHGADVVELYVIGLNTADTGKSIRYTEIKYFDADTRKPVDNNVYFKLADSTNVVESKVERIANDGYSEIITGVQYQLPPSSIFRTMVQSYGYNLRIGSKTEAVIRADDVVCNELITDQYYRDLWPVIKMEINEMNEVQQDLVRDDELIDLFDKKRRFWSCGSRSNHNVTFLRVESFVNFTLPVHYVEYYDGVEIIWPKEDKEATPIKVVEVKFVSGGKVIRFEGKLTDQEIIKDRIMFTRHENLADLFPKEGDIYPLPASQVPVRKNYLQDYKWDGETYETSTVIENKENSLEFIVNGNSGGAESELNLIICEINEEQQKQFPEFEVKEGSTTTSGAREELLTEEMTVIWLCKDGGEKIKPESGESAPGAQSTSTESPTEVIRIVTKQNLNKTNPGEVGKIKHSKLDKIWLEMADTEYKIEIEGIRYYSKTGDLQKQLNSFVIFEDEKRTGKWKSGTIQLTNFKEKSKTTLNVIDIQHNEFKRNAFKQYAITFQTQYVEALHIGYKYKGTYGNRMSELNCVEDPTLAAAEMNNKKSPYRTRLLGLDNNKVYYELNLDDFFIIETMRIWNCTDETGKNIQGVMQTLTKQLTKTEFSNFYFFDGITMLYGKDENSIDKLEFTEFRYLDENKVEVKYEGKVTLDTEATLESKLILDSILVTDVFHLLLKNPSEIYRTKLNSKGATLEIGDAYKDDPHMSVNFHLSCSTVNESTVPADLRTLLPSKVIKLDSEKSHPIKVEESQLNEFFTTSRRVFSCKSSNYTYYRVVNHYSTTKSSKPIKQIYHFDGVTIRYIHESRQYEIEEIRYLLRIPGTDGTDSYEPIKLIRLTGLPRDEFDKKFIKHRESIGYFLDTEVLLYSNLVGTGRTIELESDYQTTIELEKDDYAICRLIRDRAPDSDVSIYNSKVCLNLGSEDENIYVDIMDEKANIGPTLIVQEQWLCKNIDEDVEFIRLFNKIVSQQLTDRYYYNPSVLLGTLFLPNGKRVFQLSHVKFVVQEDGVNKTAKFVGKLQLIMENIPGAESFMNYLHYDHRATPRGIIEKRRSDIWSLDSMRLVYINLDEATGTNEIRDLGFSENPYSLRTQLLDTKANRMFQFGRFYEEQFRPKYSKPLSCMKFPWDPRFIPIYLPRVGEYIDGRLYMMDKELFNEAFEVLRMLVFLCTNGMDEMLFIETIYKSKIPIFAARLTDGTVMKAFEGSDGIHYEVSESVYMDVSASKVFAYVGELPVIDIPGLD